MAPQRQLHSLAVNKSAPMSKEAFTVLAEMGTPLCMTRNTVKVKTKIAKDVYISGFQSGCRDVGDKFVLLYK